MSQVSKLNYINNKLGSSAAKGQQTTRTLFDTNIVNITSTTQPLPGYFEWFVSGSNKENYFNNLPTGKLDSMESMVIKEIMFGVHSYEAGQTINFQRSGYSYNAIMNVFVGNQCVVKNFLVGSQWGTGYGPVERIFTNDSTNGYQANIRMTTDIVLPPQVDLKVTLQYPSNFQLIPFAGQTGTGKLKFMCKVSGYGTLFNAGASF